MKSIILSSLCNEVRLKLILCLGKGRKNVTELIQSCGLSQSAVSQHLEKLRIAELVKTEKEGKEIYYSLQHPQSIQISKELLSFIKEVES